MRFGILTPYWTYKGPEMKRIDAHIHWNGDHPDWMRVMDQHDLRLINICVAQDHQGSWRERDRYTRDRATGDPEVNRVVRSRVLGPIELPMLSMLGIAAVAVGVSRVFLAASKTGATVAGTLFTVFVFGAAVLMSKVELKRSAINGIVALGALAILAGGIVGAAVGERDFHEHEEDHSGAEG